jgi:mycofactocin system glycosyltransferase
MSRAPRLELDADVRRRDGGRLLVGGVPPRLLRLTDAGGRALDEILAGEPPAGPPADDLAHRLLDEGLVHPLPGDGADDPPVTTVIPALEGGEQLVALVTTLVAEGPVVVVDDGSGDGSGARAAAAGARVIRHDSRRGPAAARNAGLGAAETELVAFLDVDCVAAPGWRRGLADLFAIDPALALVAPRVRSAPGDSALSRYEEHSSPLDMGPHAGLVGPRRRTAYLPAAALLVRREPLLALGGFDETMWFGEDVDLVWRLVAAGHRVRYVPTREVGHAPRPSVDAMLRQRAGYGSAAPDLSRRHGNSAPLRISPQTGAVWVAALTGSAPLTAAALAGSCAAIARRGSDRTARVALSGLALRGHGLATRHLSRALLREWLPLSLLAAARHPRARRLLLAAAAVDHLAAAWPSEGGPTPRELPVTLVLRTLDHVAYATGVWRAAISRREARALLPTIDGAGEA